MATSTLNRWVEGLLLALLFGALYQPTTARAKMECDPEDCAKAEISTAEIFELSGDAFSQCLDYQVVGVCIYELCIGPICTTDTTLKVDHWLPELVTTAQHTRFANPWTEVREFWDPILNRLGDSVHKSEVDIPLASGEVNLHVGNKAMPLKLRESGVYGNPFIQFTNNYSDYFLRSSVTPLYPVYYSGFDTIMWRSPSREEDYLFHVKLLKRLGVMEIGEFTHLWTWGPTYPRSGFVDHQNNYKASVVIAARGASIATTLPALPHLAQPVTACSNPDCTPPGPAEKGNPKTQWQRLLPEPERTCRQEIYDGKDPLWTRAKDQRMPVAYNIWRRYRGCLPGKGQWLYSINFQ